MKHLTKAPKGHQVCLAVWPDKRDPFDRLGAGSNHTSYGDTSGSITLNLRLFNDKDQTIHSMYGVDSLDRTVMDICPRLYVNTNPAYDSVSIRGHNIYYAELMELERVVAVMKAWEKRIEDLYLGGKESLDTKIRRMFAGCGIRSAVQITSMRNTYDLIPIGDAIREFIHPAIEDIMKRFPKPEEKAA